jgi:hypothetical protein
MIYHAQRGQFAAGEAIGILLLDGHLPLPPGDVANATTYPFPMRYQVVKNASIERLLYQRDPALLQPFIEAGQQLVQAGVKAITSDCGFMAFFQREMAAALPVPVFLSSLLQVPFIQALLRPDEKVGIITADSRQITAAHLQAVGINPALPVALTGMEDQPHFHSAILAEEGTLDFARVEAEVVGVARQLVASEPQVRAILLECSNLPPYAAAVQAAVNLPVFDFNTMVHHVFSVLVRRPYQGWV